MPRIIILPQVFPPEIHPTAVMFRELAEYLVSRGWNVTVSAGLPHHPSGTLPPDWPRVPCTRSDQDGVEVLRTWHVTHPARSVIVRAAVLVSQAAATATRAVLADRADVVLVCGPPLIGPNLGALVAARHGAVLVNVIYDLYPDIAVETGKVSNSLLLSVARWAERMQYRTADMTLVLSEGFRRAMLDKGIASERVEVVPVWIDTDEIRPAPRVNSWRREQNIPEEKYVVLYAGTIGIVSGAGVVIEAARLLRHREEVVFLFVGEGAQCAELKQRCERDSIQNVRFSKFQPRARLPEVQATADLGLVTLLPGKGRTSVPSKLLGYMSAARPVIASVDASSDTAADVRASGCGVVVPPGNAEVLADAIGAFVDDRSRGHAQGQAGRDWLVKNRAKRVVLERYCRILEAMAAGSRRGEIR